MKSNTAMSQCILSILLLAVLNVAIGSRALAQAPPPAIKVPGGPLIKDGTQLFTDPQGTIIDLYVYGAATDSICTKLYNVFTHLPTNVSSPTIDARGIVGSSGATVTCGATDSPFPAAAHGKVLLGNVTITTSATWAVPAGVTIEGLGAMNTRIVAGSSSMTKLIQMGSTTSQYGVKIQNLAVDCNGYTSCIGIYNDIAEEGSMVENVTIDNAPVGLQLVLSATQSKAANSGPYRNITIQYSTCTTACASAVGVLLTGGDGGRIIRGLDNITIAACTVASNSVVGVKVVGGSTRITNSNMACASTGVMIGDATTQTTHNVEVEDTYFSGPSSGGVTGVYANQYSSDIFLDNITSDSNVTYLVNDQVLIHSNTRQIAGPFVGFYMRGQCATGTGCTLNQSQNPALATSAQTSSGSAIQWIAPDYYCDNSVTSCVD